MKTMIYEGTIKFKVIVQYEDGEEMNSKEKLDELCVEELVEVLGADGSYETKLEMETTFKPKDVYTWMKSEN